VGRHIARDLKCPKCDNSGFTNFERVLNPEKDKS
jgi:hypothetical protein